MLKLQKLWKEYIRRIRSISRLAKSFLKIDMELVCFIFFLLLKQFYIQPSGSLGFADLCLGMSFLLIIGKLFIKTAQQVRTENRRFSYLNLKQDGLLYIFLASVIVINTIYTFHEENRDFIIYTAYWLFNGTAIWTFRYLGEKPYFSSWSVVVIKTNIALQTVIWLLKKGRIFYEGWGGTRYMGTFNDPNQLAFFMFMMILLLYLFKRKIKKEDLVFYGMATGLIMVSKSTAAFLGLSTFWCCLGIRWLYKIYQTEKFPKWIWKISFLICIIFIGGLIWIIWPEEGFSIQEGRFTILKRIQEKIWKMKKDGIWGIFLDRGFDKFMLYPQYLLWGAGEGGFARFSATAQIHEIHSCFFSILFCYGIMPTGVLIGWLSKQLCALKEWMWPAIIALLFESFFLINYRQPLFWLILIYGTIAEESNGLISFNDAQKKRTMNLDHDLIT